MRCPDHIIKISFKISEYLKVIEVQQRMLDVGEVLSFCKDLSDPSIRGKQCGLGFVYFWVASVRTNRSGRGRNGSFLTIHQMSNVGHD